MDIDELMKTTQKRSRSDNPFGESTFQANLKRANFGGGGASSSSSSFADRAARFAEIEQEEEEGYYQGEEEMEDRGGEEDGDEGVFQVPGIPARLTEHEVQQIVDQLEEVDAPTLDLPGLRRMMNNLERTLKKNQELRIKYPDQPEKFMESEADLDEALKKLQALAAVPSLYPNFIEMNAVAMTLGLLLHDNADIANDIVDLLRELTDSDNAEENAHAAELVEAVIEHDGLSLLMQNLKRLEEKSGSDTQGVFNTLYAIENFTDIYPPVIEILGQKTGILSWLLNRLKPKAFDINKQYSAEILAILLQNSKSNREKMAELGGVDILLQSLSQYKRKDPNGSDEVELLQNLFDCLCSSLLALVNKEKFLLGEGLELMQIFIREKKLARIGAFKTLSYAMNDIHSLHLCNRFIDIGGLKTLFAAFLKKGTLTLQKTYKDNYSPTQEEEHIVSVIASLFKYSTEEDRYNRLLVKFVENNFEKIDALVDLHIKYLERLEKVDDEIAEELQGNEPTEYEKDEFYLRRLDAGLFTLQLIDFIFATICASPEPSIKEYAFNLLRLKGKSVDKVIEILKEYGENVGEVAEEEVKEKERSHIRDLVEKLSGTPIVNASSTTTNSSSSTNHEEIKMDDE